MTSDNEREQDVEPAGHVKEAAEAARQRPRTRVFSEALVAAIPAAGEPAAAAPAETPRRPPRWVSEAVVAAIPAAGETEPGGGADDGDGAGA
jgi:hypothetical protein